MAKQWNLGELIDDLQFKLNYNEGQTDQDFIGPSGDTDRYFRRALNESYVDEYQEAVQSGDDRWFYATQNLTWPANSKTVDVPEGILDRWIVSLYDITNGDPGTPLWFNSWEDGAIHLWRDSNTMQWGDAGPSSAKTIRFTYISEPRELVEDDDEPTLIPNQYRHVISWSAAIKLRIIADEAVPKDFVRQRDAVRARMMKHFTLRGPIQTGGPGIRNHEPDYFGFYP